MENRYLSCLLGLAVGDALGTTLEFKNPGSFEPIDRMVGGGPFELDVGQWTDDTSMALCLAESLIEQQGFDAADQMRRYVRWMQQGHLSSTGNCFDIGNTVHSALTRFMISGSPYSGDTDPYSAGNGSIMRLAPIPLVYRKRIDLATQRAAQSSRTTHGAAEAVDACRLFTVMILGALEGRSKSELLTAYEPIKGMWQAKPLVAKIEGIRSGSYIEKQPPSIQGTGYVVKSLEAALWAFATTDDFREGALKAVNLGDDADTTGAVYGQIAGAYYGHIPEDWLSLLCGRPLIESMASKLYQLSENPQLTFSEA